MKIERADERDKKDEEKNEDKSQKEFSTNLQGWIMKKIKKRGSKVMK